MFRITIIHECCTNKNNMTTQHDGIVCYEKCCGGFDLKQHDSFTYERQLYLKIETDICSRQTLNLIKEGNSQYCGSVL